MEREVTLRVRIGWEAEYVAPVEYWRREWKGNVRALDAVDRAMAHGEASVMMSRGRRMVLVRCDEPTEGVDKR